MSRHTDTYVKAKAPKVKGVGVDTQERTWLLQGTSCDFDCHTGEVAWLAENTGTSGWGFHVHKHELAELKVKLSNPMATDEDGYTQEELRQLDRDTISDDHLDRWDHLQGTDES